jgi:hypothetical protein
MGHYVFNVSTGDRAGAEALLRARMWGIGAGEPHAEELAPGDLALIYVASPEAVFIGRAEVATVVRDWTSGEAAVYPGDASRGVVLSRVEAWEPPVPMEAAVQRIDPSGTNPLVQANAASGFGMGVVRITHDEYEAALALSRGRRRT